MGVSSQRPCRKSLAVYTHCCLLMGSRRSLCVVSWARHHRGSRGHNLVRRHGRSAIPPPASNAAARAQRAHGRGANLAPATSAATILGSTAAAAMRTAPRRRSQGSWTGGPSRVRRDLLAAAVRPSKALAVVLARRVMLSGRIDARERRGREAPGPARHGAQACVNSCNPDPSMVMPLSCAGRARFPGDCQRPFSFVGAEISRCL